MKSKVEVSVVIPIYNGMPYLKETIESILNQSYKNFELILINDGSTDNSEDYIKTLCDDRIRYIYQNNMGLCKSLNKAFSLARGKYILRNDQDDVSVLTRIERQVEALKLSNYSCVFSFVKKISGNKEWSNLDKVIENVNVLRDFDPWLDGCMLNSTMAIEKKVFEEIGGYRENYYPSDDWDLELRLIQKFPVGVIEEVLLKYRFHDGANTYKYWEQMQNKRRWAEDSFFKREKNIKESNYDDYLNEERKILWKYLNRRRKDKAKLYMRKSGSDYGRRARESIGGSN